MKYLKEVIWGVAPSTMGTFLGLVTVLLFLGVMYFVVGEHRIFCSKLFHEKTWKWYQCVEMHEARRSSAEIIKLLEPDQVYPHSPIEPDRND